MNSDEIFLPNGTGDRPLLKMYFSTAESGKRKYTEHHHTELEISLVLAGSCEWQIRGRSSLCARGDIVLIGSDEEHYITGIGSDEALTLLNLHFEPQFIWAGGENFFDSRYLRIFLHHEGDFDNCIKAEDETAKKISALMKQMYSECRQAREGYVLIVKAELLLILALLGRKYADIISAAAPSSGAHLKQLDEALNYINANLTAELTLEDIARRAGMSRSYFSTMFKTLNGVSVWEYITSKRIALARKLIREGGSSITEISGMCGFGSIANFNRSFKLICGCTPSEYRKNRAAEI